MVFPESCAIDNCTKYYFDVKYYLSDRILFFRKTFDIIGKRETELEFSGLFLDDFFV